MSQDLIKQQLTKVAKTYSAQEQHFKSSVALFTFFTTTDHTHIVTKHGLQHCSYSQITELPAKKALCTAYKADNTARSFPTKKNQALQISENCKFFHIKLYPHKEQSWNAQRCSTQCVKLTVCPLSCSVSTPINGSSSIPKHKNQLFTTKMGRKVN